MKKFSIFISVFVISILCLSCSQSGLFSDSGDIGPCKLPGSMSYDISERKYTLTGAGTNMWGPSDEFFMAWKSISGDFSLSARIAFEGTGVDPHRKMGLIIRESLDRDAVYADVAVHGDGLTSLQYRPQKGAETEEVVSPNTAPDHILLERRGNSIRMKTAHGSFSQTTDGEITINLPETCYVGLFICSHNEDVIEKGYFTEVELRE